MAENVVSIFLQRLDTLMSHGGRFFVGVERQVQSIRSDLGVLSGYLQDADRKRRRDEHLDEWVREVQSFVYEAANTIDEFVLKVERRQQEIPNGIRRLPKTLSDSLPIRHAMRLVEKGTGSIYHWMYLRSFRKKIADHRKKLLEILSDLRRHDTRQVQHNRENRSALPLSSAGNMALFVEQAQVVGLEQDVHMLLPKLIGGEPRLSVISIVGMRGLGKTTLASILFRSSAVVNHFDCRVWVTITQKYTPELAEQLLLGIIKSLTTLTTSERKMNGEELRHKIFQHLRKRRYLVVIDDIWSVEPWDGLRGAFPDEMNGSRIMLTTRDKALRVDIFGSIHKQRLLSEEESWVLFCNIAFWNTGGAGCPPNLVDIGKEMVSRCHGLPLAIKALGGRLSAKERHPAVWGEVLEGLRHLSTANWGIQSVLDLSYDDLPYNFKSCFLYCGIFPDGYEIASSKLIRMWIAEGFIQGRGEHVMEDVANEILDELISRIMIQPMKMGHSGRVKTFRIHDLLRDLSISKAKEDNFVEIIERLASCPTMDHGGRAKTYQRLTDLFLCIAREFYSSKTNESIDSRPTMARRLALNFQCIGEYISSNQSSSDCRSLLCFSLQKEMLQKVHAENLFQRFKFLRVMDLTDVWIPWIPDGIGNLIHLRYLGLNGACLKKLPSSLSSLYYLQTLEIRGAPRLSCLSVRDVGKMIHLRHVLVDDGCLKFTGHKRVTRLLSLQSLSMVSAESWIEDDLGKLTSIRKLGIRGSFSSHQKAFSESLGKLLCLRSLKLEEELEGPIPMSIPFPHLPNLCKLHFVGRLEELRGLSNLSPNITKIILNNSRLGHITLREMEKLSNLRFLTLDSNSYVENIMTCSAYGFPGLEVFNLRGLDSLKEWLVEEGAMASLKHLHIASCRQLKMLPEGVKHLIALEQLEVLRMPDEFYATIRDNEAADWYKIHHIPMVATGEE